MHTLLAAAVGRHRQGQVLEAETEYRRIIALHPSFAEAHNALGIALQQQGRSEEAIQTFQQALSLKPDYAGARGNLGAALLALGRRDEAISVFEAALAQDPSSPDILYNLGWAMQEAGALEKSVALYGRAIALNPCHYAAYGNLGMALRASGRLNESLRAYEQAVALAKDQALIRYGYAQALLEAGDFDLGWREHEVRFTAGIAKLRHTHLPRWQGEDIAGRSILVWAEQGLGDSIQFCRYLPLLRQSGATVIFEVQEPLWRLCASMTGINVIARGSPLPPADIQVPLMSLPLLLGQKPFTPPIPYLSCSEAKDAEWKLRLGARTRPRVGLVWAGSPTHKDDHNRSLPLQVLHEILREPEVEFFSFQVGPAAAAFVGMHDLSEHLNDFADSAAAMCNMDLLIGVDTSVLHLAGALGCPAWALLPFASDWRWLHGRDDSPWYPSLRLFRQNRRQDWSSVIDRILSELKKLVELS